MPAGCGGLRPKAMTRLKFPTTMPITPPAAIPRGFSDMHRYLAAALLAQGGKLGMPVLAIGAEKSLGTGMADISRSVASNVEGGIVPHSGHWIMEENPQDTVDLVTGFL